MLAEDLRLQVRTRRPWEAIDLGVRMTCCWWRDVYAAWFVVTLPIFLLLNVVFIDSPLWALMVMWWLKPLYDRVLLQVYSQAVFGRPSGLREVLAALPRLLGNSGLLLSLTLYRLDPTRSLRLPVWQLEGLRGSARSSRYRVLAGRTGSYAWWLMVAGVHLEWFLQLAVFGLIWLFTPALIFESLWQQGWNLMSDSEWQTGVYLALNGIHYLSISAIEPLYVAGGFSLYLNRRTQLEGWDLEISFRRLAQRLSNAAATNGLLLFAAGLLAFGVLSAPAAVMAQPTASPAVDAPLPASESGRVIEQVLADKDFGGSRMEQRWQLKKRSEGKKNQRSSTPLPDFKLPRFSGALEVLIWIAYGVAAVALLYFLIRNRGRWQVPVRPRPAAPTVVSGMDIRPESLPDDVAAAALALWQQGRYREALGLAYRGALSALVHRYQIPLEDSATEGDVLHAARGRLEPAAQACLGELTRLWQTQAYAHRRPDEAEVLDMLAQWRPVFGRQAGADSGMAGGQ